MALTVATDRANPGEATVLVTVTGDTSYPAGGYAFTAANVEGVSDVDAVVLATAPQPEATFGAYRVVYNKTAGKLIIYVAAGTEVVAATNLSTFIANLLVFAG